MDSPDETPAASEPASTSTVPRPPLSKVMLAMDVVDTLRHHRAIVESELNEEARERALIERVKAIYESQGIDVPDDVIRKGVEALKQDRFRYEPPERTFAVRLAEIYVRRWWWTKLGLILIAIGGIIWGSIAYANHKRDRALIQGFTARVDDQARDGDKVDGRLDAVAGALSGVPPDVRPAAVLDIVGDARERLQDVRKRLAAWRAQRPPVTPDAYPRRRKEWDRRLSARRDFMDGIHRDVRALEAGVEAIAVLRSLGGEVGSALSMLAGVTISEADQARVDAMRKMAEAAIDAGDPSRAKDQVAELTSLVRSLRAAEIAKREILAGLSLADVRINALPKLKPEVRDEVDALRKGAQTNLDSGRVNEARSQLRELAWLLGVLDQAYELRIVSRPGVPSGITRAAVGRSHTPNYYIQVEAIGTDGRALELEFKSEEDQRIVKARRFGVRVPRSVYQAVKADKQKNGIVDKNIFGIKRRGERVPAYLFKTTGRWIKGE